ncbi:MAG: DUF1854 domain-containing protein [Fimbriimonadales bacterium]|jgi:hypothetical protein|nr:DUF1854 domain-containing protein [Fimbriimonadales bacterium]GBC89864.1 hypothetical protein HRbin14_00593 [bacterium HR14]GIV13272.1 MAG: hypothetical protein KatS3mg021_1554 [Fimbriimonadales bacterium]CUU03527.1 protein of unknown function (DUF1854) [Armatimonadetes bacterium GBS]CUU37573.1 protein of unknown function (DUF1854) [Armatimonadetes bacterium GXS]
MSQLEVRWLDPSRVVVERVPESRHIRIRLEDGEVHEDVQFARAFPFSNPHQYISVLTFEGKEIGMFRTLEGMAPASRAIVEAELEQRYFIPLIQKIYSLTEEYGQLRWEVETDRGERVFYVRNWRDNVHELSPVRYLIVAVDGSRYEIRDYTALDARSRAWLERLV